MHLGLSRALKTVHWTVFVRRDVPPAYDLRLPHRPAPLGRGLSSATAAPALPLCFRRSKLFSSSLVHGNGSSLKNKQ